MQSTPKRPDHDLDKFHEECALFGIYGTSDAAAHTALGLHALQHRGQEASGIVTFDGRLFHNHRAAGLVGDIFGTQAIMAKLVGYSAIGHNRYATTGGSSDRNIQPIFADFDFGGLALAHNGNLTNAYLLRKELVRIGCLFQSTTDTEVINHLIARSNYSTVQDRLKRLEESGIIAAYSIKLSREMDQGGMRAFVTLSVEPRRQVEVGRMLARFPQIETLHTVSGKYDLVAQVQAKYHLEKAQAQRDVDAFAKGRQF